ncbi:Alpha/Beta hydrolase protein [Zychaea mexicana]|uniref:Alpha/Beta hydrolase protein n=1 Tax=Zychaea mexicana TaxID=64656 RepID=UPI0022FE9CE2|nr:Alpha/Beta hydrolase protein [Zychaea mexicana]KAI9495823.1 Alpha/Beta hydrolase protein [Zychaea mexicana]
MVSISLSVIYNAIRHSLANTSSLTSILLRSPLVRRRATTIEPRKQHQQTLKVLYPRLLKRRGSSKNAVVFDTLAATQFLSSSSSSSSSAAALTSHGNDHTINGLDRNTATAVGGGGAATVTDGTQRQQQYKHVSGLDMPVTPHYRAPRAPVVLCHGLYGYDKWGPASFPMLQVHYWGGIEEALAKLGAKVIVTKVPRTGSVWERAQELHGILGAILAGNNVNFIAHSMGGLDCRYLLSHIRDRPYKVESLTTISTPHQGSPVMDWFRDHVGVGAVVDAAKKQIEKDSASSSTSLNLLDPVVQKVIQLLDTPAYANLTTDYCQGYFNHNTPNDPSVAYYSYGASTNILPWTFLGLTWQVVNEKEGDNDGIVSVESAKWGKYIKTLDANHWDLNGQRYRWRSAIPSLDTFMGSEEGKSKFDSVEFYLEHATLLYQEGH